MVAPREEEKYEALLGLRLTTMGTKDNEWGKKRKEGGERGGKDEWVLLTVQDLGNIQDLSMPAFLFTSWSHYNFPKQDKTNQSWENFLPLCVSL